MKIKIKLNRLIAALTVVALMTMLLSACGCAKSETPATEGTVAPTEAVSETAAPTQAPTEAPTEPEETQAPTEPEQGGSSVGGVGGYDPTDDDYDDSFNNPEEEEELVVPDPGTEGNPYLELLTAFPAQFTTVNIPAKGRVCYVLPNGWDTVLTAESTDVELKWGENTYTADENGVLSVDFHSATGPVLLTLSNAGTAATNCELCFEAETGSRADPYKQPVKVPGTLTTVDIPAGQTLYYELTGVGGSLLTVLSPDITVLIGETQYTADEAGVILAQLPQTEDTEGLLIGLHNGTEETTDLDMDFVYPLGHRENPEILTELEAVTASLPAGASQGYSFCWNAPEAGELTVSVQTAEPEDAYYELTVNRTGSDEILRLSESKEKTLTLHVEAEDAVTLWAAALPDKDGSFPALKLELLVTFAPDFGTAEAPYLIEDPAVDTSVRLLANRETYFSGAFFDRILTVENVADAQLKFGETVYTPDEAGTITVHFPKAQEGETAQMFSITSQTAAETALCFRYLLGSINNPDTLMLGENTCAPIPGENGYRYLWTAQAAGQLTVSMNGSNWQYTLTNVTANLPGQTHSSGDDPVQSKETIVAAAEDQIMLVVDRCEQTDAADATVTFWVSFVDPTVGTEDNPILIEQPLEGYMASVSAGQTLYLKGMFHGMILTVENAEGLSLGVGEEIYTDDGQGIISLQLPEAAETADEQTVTLTAAEAGGHMLRFQYPVGSSSNPVALHQGSNTVTVEPGEKLFCSAKADGMILKLAGTEVAVTHNEQTYEPQDGVISFICSAGSSNEPAVIVIENKAQSQSVYELTLEYPLGHEMNPQQMALGEQELFFEANDADGYYLYWTAEAAGTLTVAMAEGGQWFYAVSNQTANYIGDNHYSDDDPVVNSETLTVSAGDRIVLMMNTYDPADPFHTPSGALRWNLTFEAETVIPTEAPTEPEETQAPTEAPTEPEETQAPTEAPTEPEETQAPTEAPTEPEETQAPTEEPTEPTTE